MGCVVLVLGILMPRFVLLVGWSNGQAYWGSLFGSPIWLRVGFLVLPWTTLTDGLAQINGLSPLNVVFLIFAVFLDLSTWGSVCSRTRSGSRTTASTDGRVTVPPPADSGRTAAIAPR
jgi:hypothetical protein